MVRIVEEIPGVRGQREARGVRSSNDLHKVTSLGQCVETFF